MTLQDLSTNQLILLASVLICLLLLIRFFILEQVRRVKVKLRLRRGLQKEREAADFLRRRGYRILEAQKEISYTVYDNGEPVEICLVIDYYVRKRFKRYVVEVKSGHVAPNITHSATRRQILEYQHALNPSGIFLLDMENEEMHRIEF